MTTRPRSKKTTITNEILRKARATSASRKKALAKTAREDRQERERVARLAAQPITAETLRDARPRSKKKTGPTYWFAHIEETTRGGCIRTAVYLEENPYGCSVEFHSPHNIGSSLYRTRPEQVWQSGKRVPKTGLRLEGAPVAPVMGRTIAPTKYEQLKLLYEMERAETKRLRRELSRYQDEYGKPKAPEERMFCGECDAEYPKPHKAKCSKDGGTT